ncbi:MAG: hypothetical protein GY696_24530 [Gammaproteobacteria bacterium]|nr:hypothetical protein [Gammaproteobacteria bacterium]
MNGFTTLNILLYLVKISPKITLLMASTSRMALLTPWPNLCFGFYLNLTSQYQDFKKTSLLARKNISTINIIHTEDDTDSMSVGINTVINMIN